jgi:predicted DNA-binding protein
MEVVFSAEVQEQLERMARESGRTEQELIEDAVRGYLRDLAEVREMLDSRYDDVVNGTVETLSAEEVEEYFREKSAKARGSAAAPHVPR